MALTQSVTALLVDCSIRVPANANGTLADAAADALARADTVADVEELHVTGVTPRSNAVVVDAEARLCPALPDDDLDPPGAALADRLDDVVGVRVAAVRSASTEPVR